jgi:hypothetical protein
LSSTSIDVVAVEPVRSIEVTAVEDNALRVKLASASMLRVVTPLDPKLAIDDAAPDAFNVRVSTPVPLTAAAAEAPMFKLVPKNPSTLTVADVVPNTAVEVN